MKFVSFSLLCYLEQIVLFFRCFTLIHSSSCWHRLDVYIYDYFVKRNLQATAKAFQAEGKVSSDPVGEW